MHHLNMRFKSYRGLKISAWVSACCQPLSMQQILPKIAKICKNMQNFEIPPKFEILVLFKKKFVRVEEALEHVFTKCLT
jgi:hypothetical protein